MKMLDQVASVSAVILIVPAIISGDYIMALVIFACAIAYARLGFGDSNE